MRRFTAFAAIVLMAASVQAQTSLLAPGDFIIAVDTDVTAGGELESASPGGEESFNALDDDSSTKYLNFGEVNSGIIFTTAFNGPGVIQSMRFTTANDAVERDPTTWELYGTNDPITSVDHGQGLDENWSLISMGTADLPDDRFTLGPVYSFTNSTEYASYRIRMTGVKNEAAANSMQIADINVYTTDDGSGFPYNDFFDPSIAFDDDPPAPSQSESSYPGAENPPLAIDGSVDTKYLNFGRENSGFIVTPSAGATIVDSLQITTANDAIERDPMDWELYCTNDAITSADNSTGEEENWTLIDSGSTFLPDDRFTAGDVETVNNPTQMQCTSYRFLVAAVKDGAAANSMQLSEIQFFGEVVGGGEVDGDFNNDGAWDCTDINGLTAAISDGGNDPAFDMNGDGAVDLADRDAWLVEGGAMNSAVTGGNAFLVGDANLDGVVDVPDFNVWNANKFTTNNALCEGDFNADGVVDVPDFNAWNANKFTSSAGAAPGGGPAAVPEPAAIVLMMMAGLAFLGFRKRN
ncbi:MAG: PEP-CTERM sorting domain-containing protein [Planctomycetota bacterium]